MAQNSSRAAGRHFLQIPGPTPVPDRILRAMDTPMIDHRGPEFAKLAKQVLDGIKTIFKTTNPVIIYTATGTGAWEAALVNTLSPGDRVLMVETGQFATLWKKMAERLGLEARIHRDRLAHRRRSERDRSRAARGQEARDQGGLRPAQRDLDRLPLRRSPRSARRSTRAGHPALFMVDTISSLASTDYRHDEWGVDVTVGGAQKGLMLPPGMSFNAREREGARGHKTSKLPKSFFAWDDMIAMNKVGFFPYTPATKCCTGSSKAIEMLHEEGLDNVFARHDRLAEATRRAVRAWGLEILCRDPKYYSSTITGGADAGGP